MGKFESYPSINSLCDDDITLYNHNTVTHKINFARLAQLIKTKVSESIPIQGSTNLVTSGGIYNAIKASADSKADKATTLEGYGITDAYNMVESNIRFIPKYSIDSSGWDNTPTASSTNPVVSNGVYEAIRDATTDMVGATASADGTRGLVPKPSAGDEDKVLKGDGTWGEVTSSSSISTLTDVDLTNISDGQLLRYNGTSQKWENIGVDSTPTQNSTNPVSSGGVYTGLGKKQPTYSADSTAWDTAPTASSNKPVTSGGIKTELDKKLPTYANDSSSWDTTPTQNSTKPVTSGGVYSAIPALSYVGMVIHSTTLNTEAKVKAYYGGTKWIQHSGYVLRGATSGVTSNSATKTGGNDNATLPSHAHSGVFSIKGSGVDTVGLQSGNIGTQHQVMYANVASTASMATTFTGDDPTNANIPNYKSVYIWERTQ